VTASIREVSEGGRVAIADPPIDVSPVAQLRRVVDALVDVDPADLSDAALAAELLARRREMDRQEAAFARCARAAHTRGVGALDGVASTAAWLRTQARMREGDARAAIDAGEVSELLAETGEAWRAGDISSAAFRTIAASRVDGHDDTYVKCELKFLDLARRNDLRSLRLVTAHFKRLALADGTEPSAHDGLHVSRLYDGRTAIRGDLSDLAAETVTTALHAYTDPPDEQFPKTTSRRYAEALVRICEVALEHTGTPERARAQVSIVIDWNTLVDKQPGRLDGEFTGPIHPRDIERLLCDAEISRVVTGPGGLPLDVGRKRRNPTPAMRRALVERDGGCRWPECDRPAGFCDAHHVVPWWPDRGETKLDNLVLLCSHHHHVTHEPGWSISFDGTALEVHRPGGTGFQ
jgi:hypothetical protein